MIAIMKREVTVTLVLAKRKEIPITDIIIGMILTVPILISSNGK